MCADIVALVSNSEGLRGKYKNVKENRKEARRKNPFVFP